MVTEKECEGRVLHADALRNQLLVTCRRKGGRAGVRLFAQGRSADLPYELGIYGSDHWYDPNARFVPIYPGRDAVLFDLEAHKGYPLEYADQVIGVHLQRALVLRGTQLLLFEPNRPLEPLGTLYPYARIVRAGSTFALYPLVVDLADGKLLGHLSRRPLTVSRDGQALVALGRAADATGLAVGPLVWETPSAPRKRTSPAP